MCEVVKCAIFVVGCFQQSYCFMRNHGHGVVRAERRITSLASAASVAPDVWNYLVRMQSAGLLLFPTTVPRCGKFKLDDVRIHTLHVRARALLVCLIDRDALRTHDQWSKSLTRKCRWLESRCGWYHKIHNNSHITCTNKPFFHTCGTRVA